MLTAKQVAEQLRVPLSWVYRHKQELGGIQLSSRCLVRFFDNCIEKLQERCYALSDEKREMASQEDDRGHHQDSRVFHQNRSEEVGGRANSRVVVKNRGTDPYDLLA